MASCSMTFVQIFRRPTPGPTPGPLYHSWYGWHHAALLENLTDDAIALLYVTKFSTISLYLTKLYVT